MEKYLSLFNLDGKVAMVAGGSGDIGKAISEGLASFGATVVVCGRTLDKAKAVADDIIAAGGKASTGSRSADGNLPAHPPILRLASASPLPSSDLQEPAHGALRLPRSFLALVRHLDLAGAAAGPRSKPSNWNRAFLLRHAGPIVRRGGPSVALLWRGPGITL